MKLDVWPESRCAMRAAGGPMADGNDHAAITKDITAASKAIRQGKKACRNRFVSHFFGKNRFISLCVLGRAIDVEVWTDTIWRREDRKMAPCAPTARLCSALLAFSGESLKFEKFFWQSGGFKTGMECASEGPKSCKNQGDYAVDILPGGGY